jgi:anaerobic ribonucleoside-triphosphate reductase activating protein
VLELVRAVRARFPEKDIWCYSGYLFESLRDSQVGEYSQELLKELDVLVDGPFVLEKKDLSLRFRGSSNQRLIDVPASLRAGAAVLWDGAE